MLLSILLSRTAALRWHSVAHLLQEGVDERMDSSAKCMVQCDSGKDRWRLGERQVGAYVQSPWNVRTHHLDLHLDVVAQSWRAGGVAHVTTLGFHYGVPALVGRVPEQSVGCGCDRGVAGAHKSATWEADQIRPLQPLQQPVDKHRFVLVPFLQNVFDVGWERSPWLVQCSFLPQPITADVPNSKDGGDVAACGHVLRAALEPRVGVAGGVPLQERGCCGLVLWGRLHRISMATAPPVATFLDRLPLDVRRHILRYTNRTDIVSEVFGGCACKDCRAPYLAALGLDCKCRGIVTRRRFSLYSRKRWNRPALNPLFPFHCSACGRQRVRRTRTTIPPDDG